MYAIALLIVVAIVSLLITRLATIALTVTGMPRESARFQARSALSGVGFTTRESEAVVNHPVRRRIVMALMLLGSMGLATAVAGLLAGVMRSGGPGQTVFRIVLLLGGLGLVYLLSLSSWVNRQFSRVAVRLLRRFTDLEVHDFARLLHLSGDYSVREMATEAGDWIVDQPLGALRLRDEGVLVLGIVRTDGSYVGAPGRDTEIHAGDTVILYGQEDALADLASRRRGSQGDEAHRRAAVALGPVRRREQQPNGADPETTAPR